MSARDYWSRNNILANDPARAKSRFMGGNGASDYFERVKRYNTALYAPADTRPGTQPMPTSRMGAGWQQPRDPLAIAARYGTTGTWATSNTAQAMDRFGTQRPGAGAAGPTGDEIDTQYPSAMRPAVEDQSTVARMPGSAPRVNSISRWSKPAEARSPDTERARENWMSEGGTQRSWNKAGVAAGIRPRIDGRAAPDPQRSTASDDIRAAWDARKEKEMPLPY